jgi:hypothetical protein
MRDGIETVRNVPRKEEVRIAVVICSLVLFLQVMFQ